MTFNHNDPLEMDFVPPINIPLRRLKVTYRVGFTEFLEAARRAAHQLGEGKVGRPVTWEIDGYNSDLLFLTRWHTAERGSCANPFRTSFELDRTATTVTVGVYSRWESDLDVYRAFLWHLDVFLPRKRM